MQRRTVLKSLAGTALSLGTGPLVNRAFAAGKPLKVGFIYIAPIDVIGWTYQHELARKEAQQHFGSAVETTFVDKVASGGDAERVMQDMAQSGCELIFATATPFMNATLKVAKRFPNVKFEIAGGYKQTENISNYFSKFYEGRYIQGIIAGKMTKTNTLGFVAAVPIPEVVFCINSLYLGAKSVNPDVKIKTVWIGTFYDPPKEAEAATALLGQGVDVMSQITDSPAPVQLAEAKGVYSYGQSSDMKQYGPKKLLTSLIDNWAPYYIERIQAALDGKWVSVDGWRGMKEGRVVLTELSPIIPDDVRKLAEDAKAKIIAGELNPFTGPLNYQNGKPWLAAGEKATDAAILSMDYFVEGVDGTMPR